jgi:hypothetical protein
MPFAMPSSEDETSAEGSRIPEKPRNRMKTASQNGKRKPPIVVAKATGEETDVIMRIAAAAALADQCEQEGNPETADAMRRLAYALWGDWRLLHSACRAA